MSHLGGRQRVAPERQHGHALVLDPAPPLLRVREVPEGDRGARAVAEAFQGPDGAAEVLRVERDDEVEVGGQARVPVQDDGNPPDHQIAGARRLQGGEDAFEVAVGHGRRGYRGP